MAADFPFFPFIVGAIVLLLTSLQVLNDQTDEDLCAPSSSGSRKLPPPIRELRAGKGVGREGGREGFRCHTHLEEDDHQKWWWHWHSSSVLRDRNDGGPRCFSHCPSCRFQAFRSQLFFPTSTLWDLNTRFWPGKQSTDRFVGDEKDKRSNISGGTIGSTRRR